MGLPIEIDMRDELVGEEALNRAFDSFRRVDDVFSTYRLDSQVSRLNDGSVAEPDLAPEVLSVLDRCEQLRLETDGYFDIRAQALPVKLRSVSGSAVDRGVDPSGYVKGWAVDLAAEILTGAGAANFRVNAGGDMRCAGREKPELVWRIGIQHPLEVDKIAAVAEVKDMAIATSGEYFRGRHIVNPHTGIPPAGVLSVSVVGPDLGTADAYATAIFAMGEEGPRWALRLQEYETLVIMQNGLVLSTPNFPRTS